MGGRTGAGLPEAAVPRDEYAAKALKKRTPTNLYNARPQWLADAHDAVDAAVAAAYGSLTLSSPYGKPAADTGSDGP